MLILVWFVAQPVYRKSKTVQQDRSSAHLTRLVQLYTALSRQTLEYENYLSQLVAVGNQSAGKSSVWSIVLGLPFLIKDTVCTRFVTKIVVERCTERDCSTNVHLGNERSQKQKQKLAETKSVVGFSGTVKIRLNELLVQTMQTKTQFGAMWHKTDDLLPLGECLRPDDEQYQLVFLQPRRTYPYLGPPPYILGTCQFLYDEGRAALLAKVMEIAAEVSEARRRKGALTRSSW